MSYSDFTIYKLKEQFGIEIIEDQNMFPNPPSAEISESLRKLLKQYVPLAISISTEKARSEFIIAPILAELKFHFNDYLSLFSGIEFNVEASQGLKGYCDYIISKSKEQLELSAPIIIIVEAKNENIAKGISQCLAEMIAAQIFNERHHQDIPTIYGIVTTGSLWRFLKLIDTKAYVDIIEYSIQQPEIILGILSEISMA